MLPHLESAKVEFVTAHPVVITVEVVGAVAVPEHVMDCEVPEIAKHLAALQREELQEVKEEGGREGGRRRRRRKMTIIIPHGTTMWGTVAY